MPGRAEVSGPFAHDLHRGTEPDEREFGLARADRGGRSSTEAECDLHPGGRPGLWRFGLLWPEADQDAAYRPAGERRVAIYGFLRRLHGLRPVAVRADDRVSHGTLLYSRQRR